MTASPFNYSNLTLEELRTLAASPQVGAMEAMPHAFRHLATQVGEVADLLSRAQADLPTWWKGPAADQAAATLSRAAAEAHEFQGSALSAATAVARCATIVAEQQHQMMNIPELPEPGVTAIVDPPKTPMEALEAARQDAAYQAARERAVQVVNGIAAQYVETRGQLSGIGIAQGEGFEFASGAAGAEGFGNTAPRSEGAKDTIRALRADHREATNLGTYISPEPHGDPKEHFDYVAQSSEPIKRTGDFRLQLSAEATRHSYESSHSKDLLPTGDIAITHESQSVSRPDYKRFKPREFRTSETPALSQPQLSRPAPPERSSAESYTEAQNKKDEYSRLHKEGDPEALPKRPLERYPEGINPEAIKADSVNPRQITPTNTSFAFSAKHPGRFIGVETSGHRKGELEAIHTRAMIEASRNHSDTKMQESVPQTESLWPTRASDSDTPPMIPPFGSTGTLRRPGEERNRRPAYLKEDQKTWLTDAPAAPPDGILTPDWFERSKPPY